MRDLRLLVVLVASLLDAACGGPGSSTPTSPSMAASESPSAPSGGADAIQAGLIPSCAGISAAPFDVIPIAPSDFLAFRPLGFLSPPIHMFPAKHSAFSMTLPGQTAVPRPVRAPGRVFVKEIWEASFSSGGRNYQLFVYPCSEVRVYFGHIASLSDRLMAEMQKVPASCNSFPEGTSTVTTCRHENMAVALESGEQMGMGPDSAGVDFGVIDFRLPPAGFIRADHYDRYYPYYASPLDYFRADVRSTLASKTGHFFGTRMRTAEPIGGTYMQDVAGTAQGNWFLPGRNHSNTTDLSPFLGLSSDYVEPAQPMMAIGTSIGGISMGLYSFAAEGQGSVNRAFSSVRADGTTYCYDRFLRGQSTGGLPLGQTNGVLLMSMPSDTTLKMEWSASTACATASRVLTSRATEFER